MTTLAERARAIGSKPRPMDALERNIRREWWLVTLQGEAVATEVFCCPEQCYDEMIVRYPACKISPR